MIEIIRYDLCQQVVGSSIDQFDVVVILWLQDTVGEIMDINSRRIRSWIDTCRLSRFACSIPRLLCFFPKISLMMRRALSVRFATHF